MDFETEVRAAATALGYASDVEVAGRLMSRGFSTEDAFLVVKAAEIYGKGCCDE